MQLLKLRKLLQEVSDLGFVPSERKGPTGIGRTLESLLDVSENNLPIPDIGGRTEIKATRSTANNLITLFTFNKMAWRKPQPTVILGWGNPDEVKNRHSLYCTVSAASPNRQGLQVMVTDNSETISVIDAATQEVIASWDLFHIVGKFMVKFERLLLVHADTRKSEKGEEFHFNQASLLTEPSAKTFRDSFLLGKAVIDIRMHLKPSGVPRNHGTGFRVHEHDLPYLFGRVDNLLGKNRACHNPKTAR